MLPWKQLYYIIFQVAIRALGFDVKKAEVQKLIKDYDRSGQGKITFQDFTDISMLFQ